MRLANDPQRYGAVAMTLHWLIALAVIGLYIVGTVMHDMEPSMQKFELFQLHKSFGFTVLALTLVRLGWRLAHRQPELPPHMPGWERFAARAAHWAFYALLLATPLAGWAVVSASSLAIPTLYFGTFTIPHIEWIATSPDKQQLEGVFAETHELLANGILFLFFLHVAAALRHHFLLGDSVLLKMLPAPAAALRARLARENVSPKGT